MDKLPSPRTDTRMVYYKDSAVYARYVEGPAGSWQVFRWRCEERLLAAMNDCVHDSVRRTNTDTGEDCRMPSRRLLRSRTQSGTRQTSATADQQTLRHIVTCYVTSGCTSSLAKAFSAFISIFEHFYARCATHKNDFRMDNKTIAAKRVYCIDCRFNRCIFILTSIRFRLRFHG